MATTAQQSNQVLEAMVWYYGKRHCRSMTFVDDVALSLEDEYFDLNVIDENYSESQYYVWLDGGTGTDPAIAGKTGLALVYTSGDTKETLAGLYVTLLASIDVLPVDLGVGAVQVENKFLGLVTTEVFTNAPSLTGAILIAGLGGELGAVASGGATFASEQSVETITRDDEGEIPQDLISKGASYTIEMTLAEMTTANWKRLVGQSYGDEHTEGSDDFVGYGTDKLYKSAFDFAGQLVGHPKRLANSVRTDDVCMWLTPANMSDITYTGQEAQGASFSFTGLPDRNKPAKINIFARGDHSLL